MSVMEILQRSYFQKTFAARGLEEHVRVSLIFAIIIIFKLFTVFTLIYVLYFEEFLIHDSLPVQGVDYMQHE